MQGRDHDVDDRTARTPPSSVVTVASSPPNVASDLSIGLRAIPMETGVLARTEKSVLFVIPWGRHWIIGTTDTDWELDKAHPAASASDQPGRGAREHERRLADQERHAFRRRPPMDASA